MRTNRRFKDCIRLRICSGHSHEDEVSTSVEEDGSNFSDIGLSAYASVLSKDNLPAYKNTISHLEKLKDDGFIVTSIPLKLQSLHEKKQVIKNFNECITWYNAWVDKNNFGEHYSESDLEGLAQLEESKLTAPIQQLSDINGKLLGS
jgi:hypothetical protein